MTTLVANHGAGALWQTQKYNQGSNPTNQSGHAEAWHSETEASWNRSVEGQHFNRHRHLEGNMVGVEGEYGTNFGFQDDTFVAGAYATGTAAILHMEGSAAIGDKYGIGHAEIYAEGFFGVQAEAYAGLTAGKDGVMLEGGIDAFAGMYVESGVRGEVFGVGGHASGFVGWGVGFKANAGIGFKDGKLSFRLKLFAGLGAAIGFDVGFSIDVRKLGQHLKNAGKKVVDGVVNAAKAVGSGIAKAAKAVGNAAKKTAEAVADTAKKAGKAVKKAAKKTWNKIKSWF